MESRIIKFINIMTKKERGYLTELYYFALSFFVYGFLGWCTEVAYAAAKTGQVCKPWIFEWTDLSGIWNRGWCCSTVSDAG